MNNECLRRIGAELTRAEAAMIADRLSAGRTLSKALESVSQSRRGTVRTLLSDASLEPELLIAVLRALEGAATRLKTIEPVWTLPGRLSDQGRLTSSVAHLVASARTSVVCATYNFEKSSALWQGLRVVAARGLPVTIYLDSSVCRDPAEILSQVPGSRVLVSTRQPPQVRSHAKFVSVDHRFLVVSSANLSASGELHNVELGLRVDDIRLAQLIEEQLADIEKVCYELVS